MLSKTVYPAVFNDDDNIMIVKVVYSVSNT